MDWDRISTELAKPLNPKHVSTRQQAGQSLAYVEGWHVIAEANRIFGFDGWDRETVQMDQLRCETVGDKWRVAFSAKVRVTAGGVVREGTGFGSGIAKDQGDAFEGAIKEAETDAMKRALMTFGNPFGLALYDKSRANVQAPRNPDDATRWLLRHIQKAETYGALKSTISEGKPAEAIKWLREEHPGHAETVDEAIEKAWSRVDPARQSTDPRAAANAAQDWEAA